MKRILFFIALSIASQATMAQTAPLGKDLVKKFSERMQGFETIQANFTFTLENLQENLSDTHKGNLNFKGTKYTLNLMGMEVFFDGTTKWQFIPDANEVTISKPTALDGGFMDDPTQIFRDYEKDFKSKFIGEKVEKGVGLYEVDLYPNDLSAPYSIIKIVFKKQTLDPVSIKYQGKDGINYIIDVNSFKTNVAISDSNFTFDVSKRKGIAIVDLR